MTDNSVSQAPEEAATRFTADELRNAVRSAVDELSKDVFSALNQRGIDSLVEFLIIASWGLLAAELRRASGPATSLMIQEIWPRNQDVARYLAQMDGSPLLSKDSFVEAATNDSYLARLIEDVLIFTDAVPVMEEHFHEREWVLLQLKKELYDWNRKGRFQRLELTIPSEQVLAPTTSRGSLQLEVSTSKPTIFAGSEFSIFVVATNQFDVPLTLYTVETQVPVDIVDVVWRQHRRTALYAEDASYQQKKKGFISDLRRATWDGWRVGLVIASEPQNRIAQAITATEAVKARREDLKVDTQITVGQVRGGSVTGVNIQRYQPIEIASVSPRNIDNVLWRLSVYKQGLVPVVLQPGDSVVKQFIFKTQSWLFFTPVAHSLQIEVRYSLDGRDHVETVKFDLTIQAALGATMVGSVLGGVLGAVARALSTTSTGPIQFGAQFVSILLAAIFSAIAIVSFARKTGTQKIISIEDFWGGFFLGFLIGFLGQEYALGLIRPGSG